MPRPIAKKYVDRAKALLTKEGHPVDEDRVNQLAVMLRDAKVLEKPATLAQGIIVIAFRKDELGEYDANVHVEFYDGKGNEQTPSAEFAYWLMDMATDTLVDALPSEEDIQ